MKQKIKILSILVAVFLCLTSTMLVYAAGTSSADNGSSVNGLETAEGNEALQGLQNNQESLNNQGESSNFSPVNDEAGNEDALRERTRLMEQTCISLKQDL